MSGSYAMQAKTLPSYLYTQYADDDALQAFVAAYNAMAQQYVTWFNEVSLPVWTGPLIVGQLLDWVGRGLYGIARPVFTTSSSSMVGPIATYPIATNPIAARTVKLSGSATVATDDIYKRCLTWALYKGDGMQFSTAWLKRRIVRFLTGVNGVDPGVTNTYIASVTQSAGGFAITLPAGGVSPILQQAFANGALPLPFQYSFTVAVA